MKHLEQVWQDMEGAGGHDTWVALAEESLTWQPALIRCSTPVVGASTQALGRSLVGAVSLCGVGLGDFHGLHPI